MLFGRLLSLLEGTLPAQVIGSEGPALAPIWRLTDIYVRLASLESRRTSFIRFVLEDLRPHAGLSTYCEFTSLGGKSSTANDRVKHPCHDARMMFAYEDGRIIIWRTQTDPRYVHERMNDDSRNSSLKRAQARLAVRGHRDRFCRDQLHHIR